jgi:MFS transporter, PPP family, 3-phenylpropionic acid transporter
VSSAARLGLFYCAAYVGTGATLPYIGLWFQHRGLSGAEIGAVLAIPLLARMLIGPALAIWADSFRLRRTGIAAFCAGAAVFYGAMAGPWGVWGWGICWFLASSLFANINPLIDVMALRRAREEGFNYGWPRGLGSGAFILANVTMGWLLTRASPELVLVWSVAAAALAAMVAQTLLPTEPVEAGSSWRERLAGIGDLLRDRVFLLAVVACGLIQSAHAFYYGFSAIAWKAEGVPESVTGLLWALGVAVEIGFMWFFEPWRRRIGPVRLLIIGGIAAVLRWTVLAFSPPLWLLFPLQALHTFTFAATFLAGLQLVERLSTARNASAAQTLSNSISAGLLNGLATIAAGALFDVAGAKGYLAMSAIAALGLACALPLARVRRLSA